MKSSGSLPRNRPHLCSNTTFSWAFRPFTPWRPLSIDQNWNGYRTCIVKINYESEKAAVFCFICKGICLCRNVRKAIKNKNSTFTRFCRTKQGHSCQAKTRCTPPGRCRIIAKTMPSLKWKTTLGRTIWPFRPFTPVAIHSCKCASAAVHAQQGKPCARIKFHH